MTLLLLPVNKSLFLKSKLACGSHYSSLNTSIANNHGHFLQVLRVFLTYESYTERLFE